MMYLKATLVLIFVISFESYANAQQYPIKAVAALDGQAVNPNTSEVSRITGYVKFLQSAPGDLLRVFVNVSGLIPGLSNTNHGFHVHTFGLNSTSDNATVRCATCGPHFNPYTLNHGDISFLIRHVGDYGNIVVDNNGKIVAQFYDTVSQLDGANSVIGRTIVLHALQDDKGLNPDEGSKTTGNAGARIACGVIGYDSS